MEANPLAKIALDITRANLIHKQYFNNFSVETGRHDVIKSVIECECIRADMAVLGGTSLKLTLGNRGRIDTFVTVKGSPGHSSAPNRACNAITGALEVIRRLESQ